MIFIFLILVDLSEVKKHFEEGDFLTTIELAKKILKEEKLKKSEKIDLHLILAYSYIALSKENLAMLEFGEALILNPELELDPTVTPPKVIKVFKKAKEEFKIPVIEKIKIETVFVRKKVLKPIHIIPGVYDIQNGKRKKGFILLGTQLFLIGFSYFSQKEYEEAHLKYLSAKEESEIERFYKKYKLWYNVRNISFTLAFCFPIINLIFLLK